MVDEEFALRFFALSEDLTGYRPPLKKFLNDYMRKVQHASEDDLHALYTRFVRVVTHIGDVWGHNAYKITDRQGRATERAPNRALFDAQMVAFDLVSGDEAIKTRRKEIIREFAKLYRSDEFLDSISLATGDRSRTFYRVREAIRALQAAGINIKAPVGLN